MTSDAPPAPAPPPPPTPPSSLIEEGDSPITEDDYVLGGGLRQVVPYFFDFKCTVKPRSEGASLVDFMEAEFPAMPRAYYEGAVATGRARALAPGRGGAARPPRAGRKRGVGGAAAHQPFTPLDPAAPLPHNAVVRHLLHRHEPPALDLPLPLLGEAGDLFAVGKPPGLPVHAAGGYRKNTVVGVLEAQARGGRTGEGDCGGGGGGGGGPAIFARPPPPRPVHRLDKPVSGVLVLARTAAAADAAAGAIARREVVKTYVARVAGAFPAGLEEAVAAGGGGGGRLAAAGPADAPLPVPGFEGVGGDAAAGATTTQPFMLDLALAWDAGEHAARAVPGGPGLESEVAGARTQAPSTGGACGRTAPKPAATVFRRLALAPDASTSLVACRPLTGRSHQLRAHLAALGHPIANDAAYGGSWPGPERPRLPAHGGPAAPGGGTAGGEGEEGDEAAAAAALAGLVAQCRWVAGADGGGGGGVPAAAAPPPPPPPPPSRPSPPPDLAAVTAACPFCPRLARPWRPAELAPLWLHAARYEGPGWAFACPLPGWADAAWAPPPLSPGRE